MSILEAIAIKGLTSLTTGLVKKFTDLGWNRIADEFSASFNEEDLIAYCKACDEYVNIRTLYSSQNDVFIDDVYVPLFMSPTNNSNDKYEISNLNFYNEGITNIIGKAGQGKSTFLRKMLINELKSGKTIPIFFELKYLTIESSLLNQLSLWFKRHNLNISEKGVSRLLKDGMIKVFLDGFDEIHPNIHDKSLSLIKDLSRSFPKATIIITTRPDTLITTEPFISNYNVLSLTKDNVRKLFMNISNDITLTNEAIEQIEKYPSIDEITKTPILAILLFITYRAWSKIPDNLSDFYKKIFITLLTHHDSLKPGKKIDRGINIRLNDHQIEDVFSAFCFISFSDNKGTFSTREASEYMEEALNSECYENINSSELVDIIKKCTGVICNDGYDILTFSHKSLQEYYAAVYICKQSIHDIRSFYKSVKFIEEEQKYTAVLSFLSSIDFDNYTKYYYIPCFQEMFDVEHVKNHIEQDIMEQGIQKTISTVSIPFKSTATIDIKSLIGLKLNFEDEKSIFFHLKLLQPIIFNLFTSSIYVEFLSKHKDTMFNDGDTDELVIPLVDVLAASSKESKMEFYSSMYDCFNKNISITHKAIMDKSKKRNKPSLLNQVFKKKKKETQEV